MLMNAWANVAAKLLSLGNAPRITHMYIEFDNVASPGDTAVIPTFNATDANGRSYYQSLSGSSTRDYLRVPVLTSEIVSTDPVLYPDGNQINFIGITQGTQGVHGRTFSSAVNSKVCGGALVVPRNPQDITNDVVVYRFYTPGSSQELLLPNKQLTLMCTLTLV